MCMICHTTTGHALFFIEDDIGGAHGDCLRREYTRLRARVTELETALQAFDTEVQKHARFGFHQWVSVPAYSLRAVFDALAVTEKKET
jgi:hypothetical protein